MAVKNKKRRRVAVFTGKRGGFEAMLGIMTRIRADASMELKVIASDMHLSDTFGNTVESVRDQIQVDAIVDLGQYQDTPLERTRALGRCIEGLAPVLSDLEPDILLLLGDRGETLAAAMCAVEVGIVIAHIQAGDISGGIDDIHRNAITKLSHLHFSQNARQRERVVRLGEDPDRIWDTGAPYIDGIVHGAHLAPQAALEAIGAPTDQPYFLVLQHSETYRPELSYDHAMAIFEVMAERPDTKIVVYPCSDPGYAGVLRAIEEFQGKPGFHIHPNIERGIFLGLMSAARALVGNSSAGIIEAPYFELPFVCVGARQDGRDAAENVIFCEGTPSSIGDGLARIETREFRAAMQANNMPFGDGNASQRIFDVLRTVDVNPALFRKRMTY